MPQSSPGGGADSSPAASCDGESTESGKLDDAAGTVRCGAMLEGIEELSEAASKQEVREEFARESLFGQFASSSGALERTATSHSPDWSDDGSLLCTDKSPWDELA